MRSVVAEFEAVYAKVNHRVSRYGEAGFTITELGLIATADKVKPLLVKRGRSAGPIRRRPTRASARPISAGAGTRPISTRWTCCSPATR